jgi:hemolysin III
VFKAIFYGAAAREAARPPAVDHLHGPTQTASDSFLMRRIGWLSTGIYLLMGWIIVLFAPSLGRSLSTHGLYWLFGGGFFYSAGALVYMAKKVPFHHAAWHLCVVAGSACHVFAVLFHVIPGRA